jgi:excisionase family DNA binding protein
MFTHVIHIIDLNRAGIYKLYKDYHGYRMIVAIDTTEKKTFKEKAGKDDNTTIEDLFMEKICIVRRRIQNPALPEELSLCIEKEEQKAYGLADLPSFAPDGNGKQHISPFRSAVRDDDHVIRIQLTSDQCKVVQSNGCFNHLLGKILGNIDIDIERYEDGQIVFNLHIKQVQRADMLDSKKVCQMLQISKSFLVRLMKTERIKSYKLGRLRRFLLEDILEYLSQSEVMQKTMKHVPSEISEVLMKEQLCKQPAS